MHGADLGVRTERGTRHAGGGGQHADGGTWGNARGLARRTDSDTGAADRTTAADSRGPSCADDRSAASHAGGYHPHPGTRLACDGAADHRTAAGAAADPDARAAAAMPVRRAHQQRNCLATGLATLVLFPVTLRMAVMAALEWTSLAKELD